MKALCTWGEGPDVLVEIDGTPILCYENPTDLNRYTHGIIREGSFYLTVEEAKKLVGSLLMAISQTEELYQSYENYVEVEEKFNLLNENEEK